MASEVVEVLWKRFRDRREMGLPSLKLFDAWRLCRTISRRKVLREIERLDAKKHSGETKETHYGMDVEFLPIHYLDTSIQEFECNEEIDRFLGRIAEKGRIRFGHLFNLPASPKKG